MGQSFAIALLLLSVAMSASAEVWSEVGDAPDSVAGAQVTMGSGPLDRITGTISPNASDVDLYLIKVVDPPNFSATTTNGDSSDADLEFDAVLALFDAQGVGIYLNDDRVQDDGNAELPAGHPLSPISAGNYILAIFDDNLGATSAGGLIFPQDTLQFPFTDVLGPTGPGGGQTLSGFVFDPLFPPLGSSRAYTLEIIGAPEPSASALGLAALAALCALGRFRQRTRGSPA